MRGTTRRTTAMLSGILVLLAGAIVHLEARPRPGGPLAQPQTVGWLSMPMTSVAS